MALEPLTPRFLTAERTPPVYAPPGGVVLLPAEDLGYDHQYQSLVDRVREIKPEDLSGKTVGLLERIFIAFSSIFTLKYLDQYVNFRKAKDIALDGLNHQTLPEVELLIKNMLASQRNYFVTEFTRQLIVNHRFDEAEKLLKVHSDQNDPHVIFLYAALYERNCATELGNRQFLLKAGEFSLEQLKNLPLPALQFLSKNRLDPYSYIQTVAGEEWGRELIQLILTKFGIEFGSGENLRKVTDALFKAIQSDDFTAVQNILKRAEEYRCKDRILRAKTFVWRQTPFQAAAHRANGAVFQLLFNESQNLHDQGTIEKGIQRALYNATYSGDSRSAEIISQLNRSGPFLNDGEMAAS